MDGLGDRGHRVRVGIDRGGRRRGRSRRRRLEGGARGRRAGALRAGPGAPRGDRGAHESGAAPRWTVLDPDGALSRGAREPRPCPRCPGPDGRPGRRRRALPRCRALPSRTLCGSLGGARIGGGPDLRAGAARALPRTDRPPRRRQRARGPRPRSRGAALSGPDRAGRLVLCGSRLAGRRPQGRRAHRLPARHRPRRRGRRLGPPGAGAARRDPAPSLFVAGDGRPRVRRQRDPARGGRPSSPRPTRPRRPGTARRTAARSGASTAASSSPRRANSARA
jgi:hypothetical protein